MTLYDIFRFIILVLVFVPGFRAEQEEDDGVDDQNGRAQQEGDPPSSSWSLLECDKTTINSSSWTKPLEREKDRIPALPNTRRPLEALANF